MKKHALTFAALTCLCLAAWAANPTVTLDTSLGEIVVELNADKAPRTTENFVQYVKDGHYDGTIFHRVIDGFMIQGGGFDDRMNQKPTRPPIENEANNGLKNLPGTLAMARTSSPHSASAQFFINLVPNRSLDYPSPDGWGYAVFGKVVHGMEVVEKIAKVPTTDVGFHQNVPATPVVIRSARLNEAASAQEGGKKTDKR
jgi:peptidyl-prolyl cis-trans isomerase A (cyclophilin A)